MLESKRKRLEGKGWRVGSTAEFLVLSKEETAYIDMRLRLAEGLRVARSRRRLTQIDVARVTHSSQSRIAKMEAGDPTVSLDLLIRTLLSLGASRRDVAGLIAGRPHSRAA